MTPVFKDPYTNTAARLLLVFAALAFLSAACMMPAIVPKFLLPTPTPGPPDYCATVGPDLSIVVTFDKIEPAQAAPGQEVKVSGSGRYFDWCTHTPLAFKWNHHFTLYFDGEAVGVLACPGGVCEGRLTVPEDAQAGTHAISSEGGAGIQVLVVAPEATGQVLTPTPSPAVSGCPGAETAEMVWPELTELQPARAAPGGAVKVMGSGGYARCGEAGYDESARSFQLFFDRQPVAQIGCYVNHCEVEFAIPPDASPGAHAISVEGGSSINIEITSP